jgi:DUF2958 family protein
MAGRAPASIQRFFRLRVSLREPPETNRILGDPQRLSARPVLSASSRNPLTKGETYETFDRRYPQKAAPQWQASPATRAGRRLLAGGETIHTRCRLHLALDRNRPGRSGYRLRAVRPRPRPSGTRLRQPVGTRSRARQTEFAVERDLYFAATKTLSAYADEARAHGAIVA